MSTILDTYIVNEKAIHTVAKGYKTLDYYVRLNELLKIVYPTSDLGNLSKYELHKLLNDTLLNNYNGEEILKYKLSDYYLNQQNIVAAFEIKVNNSRVDFLTINGNTKSFEIKSELDNLSKLAKQMADYMLAFEYNYLVVDEKHIEKAKDLLPQCFGVWSYTNRRYIKRRKAELSNKLDPEVQLTLLTKKELISNFREHGGVSKKILRSCDAEAINRQFKKALKDRYRNRWNFLAQNQSAIFPIDYQFFFNTNIEPRHVYY